MLSKALLEILPGIPFCKLFTDKEYPYGIKENGETITFDECETHTVFKTLASSPFEINTINTNIAWLYINLELHVYENSEDMQQAYYYLVQLRKHNPNLSFAKTKKGYYNIIRYQYKTIIPCDFNPEIIIKTC